MSRLFVDLQEIRYIGMGIDIRIIIKKTKG